MTTAIMDRTVEAFAKSKVTIPDNLQILSPEEEKPEAEGTKMFSIISQKDGDKRVVWNSMKLAEINSAKKMFDDLIKQGMQAFSVGVDGKATSDRMTEFDPTAEEVMFLPMPAVVGG